MNVKAPMNRAVLNPPLFATFTFVIPESIRPMHRPDSIYIPALVELPPFHYAARFSLQADATP